MARRLFRLLLTAQMQRKRLTPIRSMLFREHVA